MARGEVAIDEKLCKGCGYCIKFCSRGCLEASKDRFTSLGLAIPVLAAPEKCNACAVCAWMCPDFAIEVYKYVEAKASASP